MTTTGKVLLIAASVVVAGIGAAGWVGYRWWQTNGRAYIEGMKAGGTEGTAFASTADNAGCVDAGIERSGRDTTMGGLFKNVAFLHNCLHASKTTPGFCDEVPTRSQRAAVEAWASKKCDVVDQGHRFCVPLMSEVVAFCHRRIEDTT